MEALRGLYIVIDLADRVSAPLKQINKAIEDFRKNIEATTKPIRDMQTRYLYMSQAFDQSLSQSRFFFAQMDLAAKEAAIRTKYATKPVQDLALAFERVKMKVREYTESLRSRMNQVTKAIEDHKEAILAIGAGLSALGYGGFRFFRDATKDLADFQDAMRVFRNYAGENADAILKAMEEAAEGTIDSTQMIINANRAIVMGIDPQYLPEMMRIARAAARAMGTDVQYMFESIAVGTARQSKLILDNLGIIINAEEAYSKYAKSIGKTAEQLTEAEKRQAFINAVMESGRKLVERVDLSQETLNEQLMKSQVAWREFKKSLAEGALPVIKVFTEGLERVTAWLKDLPAPIKAVIGTAGVLGTAISGTVGPLLMQIAAISWLSLNYATLKNQILDVASSIFSRLVPATVAQAYATGGLTAALRAFATTLWATLAPLLPWIALIGGITAAILLLQDVLVKGWEKSRLHAAIQWLLDRLPFLKPVAEAVGNAINWLRSSFEWLGDVISSFTTSIQQTLDALGPFKYIVLGPASALLILASNFGKVTSTIKSFVTWLQNAWKALTENPLFKAIQSMFGIKEESPYKKVLEAAKEAGGAFRELSLKTKTINLIETSKKEELLQRNITEEEIRRKAIEQYEYIKTIKLQGITNEEEIKRRLEAKFGEIIINPKIIPYVGKPEYDRKFYEEGSIKLKVQEPVFKPIVEKPELSWLDTLLLHIRPVISAIKLPSLYAQALVKPVIAGIPRFGLGEVALPHPSELITPTPSASSLSVGNIYVNVEFSNVHFRNQEDLMKFVNDFSHEVADKVYNHIERKFVKKLKLANMVK